MSSASHRPFVMEVDEIDPLEIRNAGPLLGTDGPVLQSVFGPLPQDNAREPSVRTNMDVDGPPAASSYPYSTRYQGCPEGLGIFLPQALGGPDGPDRHSRNRLNDLTQSATGSGTQIWTETAQLLLSEAMLIKQRSVTWSYWSYIRELRKLEKPEMFMPALSDGQRRCCPPVQPMNGKSPNRFKTVLYGSLADPENHQRRRQVYELDRTLFFIRAWKLDGGRNYLLEYTVEVQKVLDRTASDIASASAVSAATEASNCFRSGIGIRPGITVPAPLQPQLPSQSSFCVRPSPAVVSQVSSRECASSEKTDFNGKGKREVDALAARSASLNDLD
ncbi:hypothetical protein B0H13DRAFT_2294853 [Mycena leptocephala]|nr:hypothetical protein B0H13DRAFT_2294853 [Mycena leptocephala]